MIKALNAPAACALALALAAPASADPLKPLVQIVPGVGSLVTPPSSQAVLHVAGRSRQAHTNYQFIVPAAGSATAAALRGQASPAAAAPTAYNTPAALACIYKVPGGAPLLTNGCLNSPTAPTTGLATGGSKVIAIVDAYDYPTAQSDLAFFSNYFHLPAPTAANFQVVYASGTKPATDSTGGWEGEAALDIETAHSIAPSATIILVEAASSSYDDLFAAVDVASNLVALAGGGEVSMSFGGTEFSGETQYDKHFQTPGVVYFASSGDSVGTIYPSASPYVVGVGGTTVVRNSSTGAFSGEEDAWYNSNSGSTGGGPSNFYSEPAYQMSASINTGGRRGIPDIAAIADPYTGVLVYDTFPMRGTVYTDFLVFGGTSVASPLVAAMTNAAGTFRASSFAELTNFYANTGGFAFRQITKGKCGSNGKYTATSPYNYCTGLGSPLRARPLAIVRH